MAEGDDRESTSDEAERPSSVAITARCLWCPEAARRRGLCWTCYRKALDCNLIERRPGARGAVVLLVHRWDAATRAEVLAALLKLTEGK